MYGRSMRYWTRRHQIVGITLLVRFRWNTSMRDHLYSLICNVYCVFLLQIKTFLNFQSFITFVILDHLPRIIAWIAAHWWGIWMSSLKYPAVERLTVSHWSYNVNLHIKCHKMNISVTMYTHSVWLHTYYNAPYR